MRHAVNHITRNYPPGVVNISFTGFNDAALQAAVRKSMDAGFVFALAAACTSSDEAAGSKLWSVWMFRHMPPTIRRGVVRGNASAHQRSVPRGARSRMCGSSVGKHERKSSVICGSDP